MLPYKRIFTDVMKLRTWRWGVTLLAAGWASSNQKGSLKVGEGDGRGGQSAVTQEWFGPPLQL